MSDTITEIRAMLMHFQKSGLKDMYIRSKDWAVFLAQNDGAANPLQMAEIPAIAVAAPASLTAISAPHLGLFEPLSAPGDEVAAGQVVALIDVLGRKTEVLSTSAGRLASLHFAANDLVEYGETLAEIAVG